MRTTIHLDEDLLKKAKLILKAETKKETIERALEQIIAWNKRIQLIQYRGKIDLDMDLEHLRSRV